MKKIILVLCTLLFTNLFAQKVITVYTYHKHAPFITAYNSGLTYDAIEFLNTNANGKYFFKLKTVPRSRLNYILKPWINKQCITSKECNKDWIILWVNQKWGFGKDSESNFLWTPLLDDSNVIVSSSESKIEYTSPTSLIGKSLIGVSGHKYVGIDDLVKEKKIKRINGVSEVENLYVIQAKRADATLLPYSAYKYYINTNKEFNQLYVAKTPHQKYMRNIMTNIKNKELYEFLNSLDFSSINK